MKTLTYKNQTIEVVKVYMEWQNKYYWVFRVSGQGGDDLYRTQKDAIYAAKYTIDNN